jgi:hypothetical protein
VEDAVAKRPGQHLRPHVFPTLRSLTTVTLPTPNCQCLPPTHSHTDLGSAAAPLACEDTHKLPAVRRKEQGGEPLPEAW